MTRLLFIRYVRPSVSTKPFVSVCMYVFVAVCVSASMYVCLFVCLSVCLVVCLSSCSNREPAKRLPAMFIVR